MSSLNRFKIGDHIVAVVDHPRDSPELMAGDTGVVVTIDGYNIGVEWDRPLYGGHSLNGLGQDGCCWWVFDKQIELEEQIEPFSIDELNIDLFG